jgi:predicted NAD-dependent protein-ADP-ribosyltransferase YbiA (DUF1768 family)
MIKAKSAKAKGRKLEQWIVKELEAIGIQARRQPGSGAFEAFPHDVEAVLPDGGRVLVEAKQRKDEAWATGERWLGQADILVVRIDPDPGRPLKEPRVYMTWSTFARLVK